MADPSLITLTTSELGALADRLFARGVSRLAADTTEQSRDLRIASRALRALLSEVDRVAGITGDVAHSLHNLKIAVEG
jgi:hypothetical protein